MIMPLLPDANQLPQTCESMDHTHLQQQLAAQASELVTMQAKVQQLEEALAASEARCRAAESTLGAILNSPVAAISYGRAYADRRIEIVCLSAGFEVISGYTLAELQTSPGLWLSRIYPEDLEQVVLPSFEHLFAGETRNLEFRLYHKNGSLRWVSAVCTATWDGSHGWWELIGFFQDITDRQQLLHALRTSETRLSDILNTTLVAITSFYIFDDDRRLEYCYGSAGCELVFGYTAEEFLADSNLWLSRVHPDDRFIAVQFSHQFSPGKIIEQEYRFFHKDGRLRWLMSKIVARRDQALGCWVFTAMDTDITDRKHTELTLSRLNQRLEQEVKERTASLAERNAELESMFRAFPDLLFRLAADGTHLDYKSQGSEGLYCPPEEFMGRKIQDVLPPPAGQQLFTAIQTCLQRNTIVDVHYTLSIQGRQEYYEARIVPYKPDQVLQIVRNVTQQQQAERALYQSEALFRQLFEEAPIAITLADPKTGKIIRCNSLLSEVTGYSLAELMTMSFVDFTHPEDIAADFRSLQQLLAGATSRYQMEKRYIHKDGHQLWVHLVVCLIRDQAGNPLYALGMSRDITESKRIETELIRNRDLFQATFEESADAIFLVDQASLLIITCNQRAVELFEADSREDLVGVYGPTLHKSPLTPEQQFSLFVEATEYGCAQLEVEYLTKTGRSFWGSLTVKLIT
ncbi:MAG: PAS domain S-box protein, partial [Cyanobacteria bacterium]|nr:PAS domain S-box protein [Cyanobacteriota bacterium]MDW8202292.1 PAS domain S-box protein [Cyanobacteriota bacterium SKYGB_h_bin112]